MWTDPVDYVILAGKRSPGIADVLGASAAFEFNVHQPPFATGARIVFKRRELAKFEVRLRLYSFEHLRELEAWRPLIDTPPGARRAAQGLDIVHPLLNPLGITSCVVTSVGQLEPIDNGAWMLPIKFLEYRGLPKQSLAKVEGSKAEPVDPVEQRILTNNREIERLAQELAQ